MPVKFLEGKTGGVLTHEHADCFPETHGKNNDRGANSNEIPNADVGLTKNCVEINCVFALPSIFIFALFTGF